MNVERTWNAQVVAAHRELPAAVVGPGRTWSGAELLGRAAAYAAWLERLDVPHGTAVPVLVGRTGGEAMAATLGGAAAGRPLAALGPRLTVHELAPVVKGLDSPLIIGDARTIEAAERVAAETGVRAVALPDLDPIGTALATPPPEAVALVLHTSGTTGLPKPVPFRQDRLFARVRTNAGLLGLGPGSLYASLSPWHHIAGLGNIAVAMGAGATVAETESFSVAEWARIRALGPTHVLMVPTMIEMVLGEGLLTTPGLRALQYGGAPIHVDTLRRVLEALPEADLINMFGQTEGSPITCLLPEDHRRAAREPHLLKSVGRAAPGVELRLDAQHPETGVGEVWARGDHLMIGDAEGWLHSGDLGHLDQEGYLFLSGRKADKIVRGGENVFPVEVEDVLVTHPAVAEVGVVGVPDARLGETVAAFVVPADPANPPEPEVLRAYARERLSGFKVPAVWHTVAALPRNASGKVLRRLLTAEDR